MANESHQRPINPHGVRIPGSGSDTDVPSPDAERNRETDRTFTADKPVGVSERLRAQKEGRHIPATDADGKPYADSQDPDTLEKGRARTGGPGNEV